MKPLNVESEARVFDSPGASLDTVTMRRVDVESLKAEIRRLEQVLASKERRFVHVNRKLHDLEDKYRVTRQRLRDLTGYVRCLGFAVPEPSESDTLTPDGHTSESPSA